MGGRLWRPLNPGKIPEEERKCIGGSVWTPTFTVVLILLALLFRVVLDIQVAELESSFHSIEWELEQLQEDMDKGFDRMDKGFDRMNEQLDQLAEGVEGVIKRLARIDEKFDQIEMLLEQELDHFDE